MQVIPQSVLFGNPDKAEPKLSPDGSKYAYLANSEKVKNVMWEGGGAGGVHGMIGTSCV